MNILSRTLAVGMLAIVAFGLPAGHAEPESVWRLEQRVPAGTLAIVSVENVAETARRLEQTALGKLLREPEIQAFLAPLRQFLENLAGDGGPLAEAPPIVRAALEQVQGIHGQVALAWVGMDPDYGPDLIASIDFGPNVGSFVNFLDGLRKEVDPAGEQIRVVERDGRRWFEMVVPGGPVITATIHGTTFVAATSPTTLSNAINGSSAPAIGATGGTYATLHSRVGGGDLALFCYADVPLIVDLFMEGPISDIAQVLGLDTVHAAAFGIGFQGEGFRESLVIHAPGAAHGLVPMVHLEPYEPHWLKHVPASAFYYTESRAALDGLMPSLRRMMSGMDPRAVRELDQGLAWIGDQVGVDIEKEVLAGLDGRSMFYATFPETGGLFPELALFVGAKDPTAFEQVLDRLMKGIAGVATAEAGIVATTRTLDYRGTTLHLLDLQGHRKSEMIPLTPTWARIDDAFVVTLVPHTMKEIVLRNAEGGPAGGGLAAQDDFREILGARPRDAGSVEYFDLQGVATMVWDTAVPLLQTLAKPNVMPKEFPPLDFALLPATRTVRPYLRSLARFVTWNRDGISMTTQGPVPLLGVVVVAITAGALVSLRAAAPMRGPIEIRPHVVETPTEVRDAQTEMARMQGLFISKHVDAFVAANDRLPTHLDELVESEIIEDVPSDPWGRPWRIRARNLSSRRMAYSLVSVGADGQVGTADDVVVHDKQ